MRKAGFVALVCTIIGVGVYGCKKKEPLREDALTETIVQEPQIEDVSPITSVSSEEKQYEQNTIAFTSNRDGNAEIYIMNVDGSGQKNLTNNPNHDMNPFP